MSFFTKFTIRRIIIFTKFKIHQKTFFTRFMILQITIHWTTNHHASNDIFTKKRLR